jgi:2'-5' RNA ligase
MNNNNTTLTDTVKSVFAANGLAKIENRGYNPHLTITKIPHGQQGKDRIEPSSYAELVDTEFGSHTIEGLELLEMSTTDEDGYYRCHHRLPFSA